MLMWGTQLKVIGATLCAASVLVACGATDQAQPSTSTATTTATTTAPPEQAVRQWGQRQLSPVLDDLGDAMTWVGGAMKNMDLRDARAGCRELDDAVDRLEATLPSPQPNVDTALQEAVTNFRQYSQDCQALSPQSTTQADFDQLQQYMDQGSASLERAVDLVTQ